MGRGKGNQIITVDHTGGRMGVETGPKLIMHNKVLDKKRRGVFLMITLDHNGGGESRRGPKLIMRYLNSS